MAIHEKEGRVPFHFTFFCVQVAAQLCFLFWGMRYFFPTMWNEQITAGPIWILTTFLAMYFLNSFLEVGFHRYFLHMTIFSWLRSITHKHGTVHHGLTSVRLAPNPRGAGYVVQSHYPITERKQYESSTFPFYALVVFWAVFTPFFGFLQLLLPDIPILLSGYAALTCTYCMYEVSHAVMHMPYEWWEKKLAHPRFGKFWQREYGFHVVHHLFIHLNEGVGRFFEFPIADRVLGTYVEVWPLLRDGQVILRENISVPKPCRLIRWLDRAAEKRQQSVLRSAGQKNYS